MTMLDSITTLSASLVAEYRAGGYEPDGIGLALGGMPADDPTVLGYGTDFAWDATTLDVDENFSEVDCQSPAAVEQSIARLLMTPTGTIINNERLLQAVGEDPNYGKDLSNLLSVGMTDLELRAHQDLANARIREDDRILTCDLSLTQTLDASTFDLTISGVLKSGERYSHVMPLDSAANILEAQKP